MASPHIAGMSFSFHNNAGIVASYLSRKHWRDLSTKELKDKMIAGGTNGVLDLGYIPEYAQKVTPNVLVFTNPPEHTEQPEDEDVPENEDVPDEESEL
jgi:hypothetical protein